MGNSGSSDSKTFDDLGSQSNAGQRPPSNVDQEELRQRLTPLQFNVTQEKGTERPFTGAYVNLKANGMYACLICDQEMFSSSTKYNSGSGWPAFYDVIDKNKVKLTRDNSLFFQRTEVTCANCGSHLGHVFEDGPQPTGTRYCINSASLNFKKTDVKS